MAKIYIGTSGWVYPHWKGFFYPKDLREKDWLSFYAKTFKTVEINSSFYHSMGKKVYEEWSKKVPDDFVFAVKANRFITHVKRLNDCQEPLTRFFEESLGLEKKRGVILFQLPPRWQANKERFDLFLHQLRTLDSEIRIAFEFRDKSWLEDSILAILKKYNAALCIQDSPYWPSRQEITADFIYLRFHGGKMLYTSNYSNKELKQWSEKIRSWFGQGLNIFAYFNNDAMGYAVQNAKTLKEMV